MPDELKAARERLRRIKNGETVLDVYWDITPTAGSVTEFQLRDRQLCLDAYLAQPDDVAKDAETLCDNITNAVDRFISDGKSDYSELQDVIRDALTGERDTEAGA